MYKYLNSLGFVVCFPCCQQLDLALIVSPYHDSMDPRCLFFNPSWLTIAGVAPVVEASLAPVRHLIVAFVIMFIGPGISVDG